jgi:hypothetical protein
MYPEHFAQFVFEMVNGAAIVVQERMVSLFEGYNDEEVDELGASLKKVLPKVTDFDSMNNSGIRRGGGCVALDWVSGEIPYSFLTEP